MTSESEQKRNKSTTDDDAVENVLDNVFVHITKKCVTEELEVALAELGATVLNDVKDPRVTHIIFMVSILLFCVLCL